MKLLEDLYRHAAACDVSQRRLSWQSRLAPCRTRTQKPTPADHEAELRREHLMLDPKPRGEMNAMVMGSMTSTLVGSSG